MWWPGQVVGEEESGWESVAFIASKIVIHQTWDIIIQLLGIKFHCWIIMSPVGASYECNFSPHNSHHLILTNPWKFPTLLWLMWFVHAYNIMITTSVICKNVMWIVISIINHTLLSIQLGQQSVHLLVQVWPVIARAIASALFGCTSTCKSTVAASALIVRGLKCVIN